MMSAAADPPAAPQLFRQVGAEPSLNIFLVEAGTHGRSDPAPSKAREAGMPWSAIGSLAGTSSEAARQRYAKRVA